MQEPDLSGYPKYPMDAQEDQEIKRKAISAELTPEQRAHQLISLLLLRGGQERLKFLGDTGMEIVKGLLGSNATPPERAMFYLILRSHVEKNLTAETLIKEVFNSFLDSNIRK